MPDRNHVSRLFIHGSLSWPGRSGAFWADLGRSGFFWIVLDCSGAPCGRTFWEVLGRPGPGASWGGLGPPEPDPPEGSVRGVPRLCRCALGRSGAFWRVLKRPGAFWSVLGRPGAFWGVPKRPGTVPRRSGIVLRRRSMVSWAGAPKTRKACVICVRFYRYFGFRGAQEDTPGQPQPTAGT